MKFDRIFSDFVEDDEKLYNFSKFLNFNLILIMIIPEMYLVFDWIFDLIFNVIFTEQPARHLLPPLVDKNVHRHADDLPHRHAEAASRAQDVHA